MYVSTINSGIAVTALIALTAVTALTALTASFLLPFSKR
jgi:hypothetical protein